MKCIKCEALGTVILRQKDHYCENCFITNINHKFRACLGKNRVVPSIEKVLVCLSGGISSTVLLDMIRNAISLNNHKKLRITPFFLHLIDSSNTENAEKVAYSVIDQCKHYNFEVYTVHMSDYCHSITALAEANTIAANNNESNFKAMLGNMPITIRNDLLMKVRQHLFIRVAKLLQCNYIFSAETTSTAAINLLSSITVGRGAQVQDDVSYCDARDENVKLLRPMKEITKEELHYYVKINKLNLIHQPQTQENSLQSIIGTFVTELQGSFPATISTICKTADKLGVQSGNESSKNTINKCIICKSTLNLKHGELSALEATNFSRTVSLGKPQGVDVNILSDLDHVETQAITQMAEKPMFPYINEHLCYGCSRNYSEINHSILPPHIQDMLLS